MITNLMGFTHFSNGPKRSQRLGEVHVNIVV